MAESPWLMETSAPLFPQSLAGAVCAVEGIRGATALLHGSTGCKFHVSALVEQMDPREGLQAPLAGTVLRLYGQARVPCTDVWGEDLVFGGEAKLEHALATLDSSDAADRPGLVAVITTTPLAATAEDVLGVIRSRDWRARVVHVDGGGLLGGAPEGFERALKVLTRDVMRPDAPKRPGSVNLVGLTIGHPRWQDDVAELRRMLANLGVEVNAVLTAGASLAEIVNAPAAELSVVVHPEYGAAVSAEMRRAFDQPFVCADGYAPYGLAAAEAWLRGVGEAIGIPQPALDDALAAEAASVRRRILPHLAALDRRSPLKGRPVAVFGEAGPAVSLAAFLVGYLGLEVALLGLKSGGAAAETQLQRLERDFGPIPSVLWQPDLTAVKDALAEVRPDLVFGSSFERAAAQAAGLPAERHVDFGYPLWHRITVVERPFVGYRGAIALVEDIVNAAMALDR